MELTANKNLYGYEDPYIAPLDSEGLTPDDIVSELRVEYEINYPETLKEEV